MGDRPQGRSLDRINNEGNYSPENCRWATQEVQRRNSRHILAVTYNNRCQSLKEWALELGINYATLHARVSTYGWPVERALGAPVDKGAGRFKGVPLRTGE